MRASIGTETCVDNGLPNTAWSCHSPVGSTETSGERPGATGVCRYAVRSRGSKIDVIPHRCRYTEDPGLAFFTSRRQLSPAMNDVLVGLVVFVRLIDGVTPGVKDRITSKRAANVP